jgi:hypothetical protein
MSSSYQTVRLSAGLHTGPDNGVCVMELASMLAHEPCSSASVGHAVRAAAQ